MAEFYNSFAAGQANALARQKAVTERNRLAELEDLGPKVIAGDLSATDRAYALDPKRAEAYQGQQDRERQQLVGLARTLTNSASNPEYQAAVYNSAIPYLSRRFGEANIPKVWDASVVMPIAQQILDIDKNTPSLGGAGGTVQSQKIGEDGFIYNTFRDGRIVNTGVKADRQAWFRDQPGFEPAVINKDGTMQTVGPKDTLTPARPGGVQVDTVGGPVQMSIDGVPTDQQQRMAQTTALMRQSGYPEEDIDAFVAAQVKSALGAAPPRQSLARPTAAQDAGAVEMAKQSAQLSALPAELEMRSQSAINQAQGIERVKSQQERDSNARAKNASLNNVDRGLKRIESAMNGLSGKFVDTGPIDGRIMSSTPAGQELEAAVGAIQNDVLALTRVPGIGSQSDLEAKIANLKYPSIYNAPDVNARNVQQLKAFIKDLRDGIQGGSQTGGSGPAPGTVEDGYRFRGGNPSDPNSWERI